MAGKLIVLEGLDGAGTTSQAKRLGELLTQRHIPVHLTRQPSDGPIGKLLRKFLVGEHLMPDGAAASQDAFGLLFAADRLDHMQHEVAPALAAGKTVISDRWYHSSLAYQGTEGDATWIQSINSRAKRPDLTLFLRVPPEVAAERRRLAGRHQELFEDIAMQRRVATRYELCIAALADSERIDVLDGEATFDAVTQDIWRAVAPLVGAAW